MYTLTIRQLESVVMFTASDYGFLYLSVLSIENHAVPVETQITIKNNDTGAIEYENTVLSFGAMQRFIRDL